MTSDKNLIIFDFDGVIVETEKTTFRFYQDIFPDYGLELDDSKFQLKAGRKSVDFFKDVLLEQFTLELSDTIVRRKREAFLVNPKRYLIPVGGSFELIRSCYEYGHTLAIGSQNERDLIEKALEVFDMSKYFSFQTSMQLLKNKKPDPEVFLMCLDKCKFLPQQSLVIEDSPHGIEAAIACGMATIGVATSFSVEALSRANLVLNDLSDVSPSMLNSLIKRGQAMHTNL